MCVYKSEPPESWIGSVSLFEYVSLQYQPKLQ